jgi:hypothetical protein
MECPLCKSPDAKLAAIDHKDKPNDKVACKLCGAILKDTKSFFSCKTCNNYQLCANCKACRNGHLLRKCYCLTNQGQNSYT